MLVMILERGAFVSEVSSTVLAMTNPASLLAKQLEEWSIPQGHHPQSARTLEGDNDLTFWQRHGRAVGLLMEIERSLGGLEAAGHDVHSWWNALPHWYRAVFAYETPWTAGIPNGREAIQSTHMDMLRMLGTFLQYASATPQFKPGGVEEMLAAVAEVEDLIKVSVEMDDSVRHYMLSLIWELRTCLDEIDIFGTAGPRRLTFELAGVMFSRASGLEDQGSEASATWRDKARRLVSTMLGAASLKMVEGAAGEGFKAIIQ
ncbi:hypothetical protein ACFV1N_33015 [Streptosporangium canum]|uniref:hypothetical protein n=1 Tax=Streptosporangium canum TaxID=324952 RepID=UPI00369D9D8D